MADLASISHLTDLEYLALGQNLRNIPAYAPLVDPATRPPWTQIFLDNDGNDQSKEQLLTRFKGRYDANDPEQA